MRTANHDVGGLTARRVVVAFVTLAAVVVMHVLSTPGTSHHSPLGVMPAMAETVHAVTPGHEHAPSSRQATPEPAGHLMSMTICAFAVLIATRSLLRPAEPRHSTLVPAHEPAVRLVAGPEPPVPRFAV